jgi:hypothetical protein
MLKHANYYHSSSRTCGLFLRAYCAIISAFPEYSYMCISIKLHLLSIFGLDLYWYVCKQIVYFKNVKCNWKWDIHILRNLYKSFSYRKVYVKYLKLRCETLYSRDIPQPFHLDRDPAIPYWRLYYKNRMSSVSRVEFFLRSQDLETTSWGINTTPNVLPIV